MRYLLISNGTVLGNFSGPQPGLELDPNEEIVPVEDDDDRLIEFEKSKINGKV